MLSVSFLGCILGSWSIYAGVFITFVLTQRADLGLQSEVRKDIIAQSHYEHLVST